MKIVTVNLPDIGEGVVEGEVVEWLKEVGDPLQQDEPVVVVMTDKATVELPAPYPGKLAKQYFKPGDIAILDKPLYDIEVKTEVPEVVEEKKELPPKEKQVQEVVVKRKPKSSQKALATPATRKLARDLGIDINKIPGSGKDGRVNSEDIKRTVTDKTPVIHLDGDQEQPLIGIRNLMAQKMAESVRNAAHFSYFEHVEATRLVQLRQNVKKEALQDGIHLTYMPFFIRALSLTLKQYPLVNSSLDQSTNKIILHSQHNIGIAITTELGLIVPVLKNVQEMTLKELIHAFDKLKKQALNGKLKPQEMKDSTITISNYGVLGGGGRWATPIINYPEVAILAVNRIQKKPMVKNDQLVIRDVLNLSWSFDHRVIDGDLAASFSHHFATLLLNPASLLDQCC